jgi:hypothetical protein
MFDAWTSVMREWFLPNNKNFEDYILLNIGAHSFCLLAIKFMRFLGAYLENSQGTTVLAMLKFNFGTACVRFQQCTVVAKSL